MKIRGIISNGLDLTNVIQDMTPILTLATPPKVNGTFLCSPPNRTTFV